MTTNIRDPQKYESTFWDWTPFNDCFAPTKIRIMDIDGAVERFGNFLVIETKLPGQDIPAGQHYFYDRLAKLPAFHILIVWGKPNHPVEYQWWGKDKKPCSMEMLKRHIRAWFEHANKLNEPLLLRLVREAQEEFMALTPPVWPTMPEQHPAKKAA